MGVNPSDFYRSSADPSPFVALNQWVNPRLHCNPIKLETDGGDVSTKPTILLTRKPKKLKFAKSADDPSLVFLRSDPLVPMSKKPHYFTAEEIAEEEDVPWPYRPCKRPIMDPLKYGNLRRPRIRHPRSPLTAKKSLSGELAGNVGVNTLGDGLAGRTVEMVSPAQIECEESSFDLNPIPDLVINSCDKAMWDEAVAEANQWMKEVFPSYDES